MHTFFRIFTPTIIKKNVLYETPKIYFLGKIETLFKFMLEYLAKWLKDLYKGLLFIDLFSLLLANWAGWLIVQLACVITTSSRKKLIIEGTLFGQDICLRLGLNWVQPWSFRTRSKTNFIFFWGKSSYLGLCSRTYLIKSFINLFTTNFQSNRYYELKWIDSHCLSCLGWNFRLRLYLPRVL